MKRRSFLSGLFAGVAAAQLPERVEDSQRFRDEQYRQMDRYLTELVAKADAVRAGHWNGLDFSSPPAYDPSVARYRKEWAEFLGVPVPKNAGGKMPGLIALHGHGGSPEIVAGFLAEQPEKSVYGGSLRRRQRRGTWSGVPTSTACTPRRTSPTKGRRPGAGTS